jgi:hypothetical protein
MDEKEMQDALIGLLEDETMSDYFTSGESEVDVRDIESFKDAGVLTNNAGIVLRLMDGSEFQITIVRSR